MTESQPLSYITGLICKTLDFYKIERFSPYPNSLLFRKEIQDSFFIVISYVNMPRLEQFVRRVNHNKGLVEGFKTQQRSAQVHRWISLSFRSRNTVSPLDGNSGFYIFRCTISIYTCIMFVYHKPSAGSTAGRWIRNSLVA